MLIQKTGLPLADILALDRVQKKLPLDNETITHLRRAKLIEGRKPHLYVSAAIASATSSQADYIRTRAQDNTFYIRLVNDYLAKFGTASRKEIERLLWDKLSDALDAPQRAAKIGNLLTRMRKAGMIESTGLPKTSRWKIKVEKVN